MKAKLSLLLIGVFFTLSLCACTNHENKINNKGPKKSETQIAGTELVRKLEVEDPEQNLLKAKSFYNYRNEIKSDLVNDLDVTVKAESIIRLEDVPELRDFSSNVFIGTVLSIDGCSTTVLDGNFHPIPDEYGKILLLKNLRGEIKQDVIDFGRSGGVITIAEYEKNAPAEMIANDDKHREEAGQENIDKENTYQNFRYENDITLEAGKTYLFFANYVESTDMYAIIGFEYGSRAIIKSDTEVSQFLSRPDFEKELRQNASLPSTSPGSDLKLLNNATGEYESLDEFISEYFEE